MSRACFDELFTDPVAARVALVVAHPDDEVIGVGAQLRRWSDAHVIYVTDGAPRNGADARNAQFASVLQYAAARKAEALSALSLAGISPERTHWLNCPDQEASLNLPAITEALAQMLGEIRPAIIITQPYEGGHPDHDATAFAVHTACNLLQRHQGLSQCLLEMTAYHNRGGQMVTGEFLPESGSFIKTVCLSYQEREFKRGLFRCFKTQQSVLQYFPVEMERFRLAPHHDFTAPPHPGRLYFELFNWGTSGPRWRALAAAALGQIEAPKSVLEAA
jgi:N-acetylglucosamine malate deacetylase 2